MCKQEPFSYQNPPKYRFISITFWVRIWDDPESGQCSLDETGRDFHEEKIFELKILWNWFALEVTKGRCDITKSKYG